MKGIKGQAMAELVIALPVVILVIASGLQLLMICRAKITLAKVEHAVIRAAALGEDVSSLEKIASECARVYGLQSGGISLEDANGNPVKQSGVSLASGTDIYLCYDYQLPGFFYKISGKKALRLRTFIHVPSGGSFKNPGKNIMDVLWKSFPGF